MQEQKSRQPAGGKSSFSPNALGEMPGHESKKKRREKTPSKYVIIEVAFFVIY